MINILELRGIKNVQKGKLKQKIALIKKDALLFAQGKNDEMEGKIQIELSKSNLPGKWNC